MNKVLAFVAFLLACVTAQAQNFRFDAQATTVSTYGAAQGFSVQVPLLALPGATISFYSCSGATAFSCNTPANTYNTATSTTPCPSSTQVVLQGTAACTSNADSRANFGAWFLPSGPYGYAYTITANNQTYGPFQFTVGGGGGGGTSTPSYQIPSGAINGTNTAFTLASMPAYMNVYLNGLYQTPGVDYTVSGGTLYFTNAPAAGDTLFTSGVTGAVSGSVALNAVLSQSVFQAAGTSFNVNVLESIFYADQFCAVPGVYDQTCLANAVTTAGSNSRVVLSPHTYVFASSVSASNLTNLNIEGNGATIEADGDAFTCTNCTAGSFKGANFRNVTVPTVISCTLVAPLSMNCPGLPATGVVVLDPWGTGVGHIPTSDDVTLLASYPSQTLTTLQQLEVFDTGISYVNSKGVEISGLTGLYFHIDLFDVTDARVHDNFVQGGRGVTPLYITFDGSYRCGAICIRSQTPASGNYNNARNLVYHNSINYAASDGIQLTNGRENEIFANQVKWGGESGYFLGEGATYYSIHSKVTGNLAFQNDFDGFDVSTNYPHTDTFSSYNDIENNSSISNFHVGFTADGGGNKYVGNTANTNGLMGFQLDVDHSLISDNKGFDNMLFGTGALSAAQAQMAVSGAISSGGGSNTVNNNHFTTDSAVTYPSYGITVTNYAGNPPEDVSHNAVYSTGGTPEAIALNVGCSSCTTILDSYNYDAVNGPTPQLRFYGLAGGSNSSATWYKLGTLANFSSTSATLTISSGSGYTSGGTSNQQSLTYITVRGGNGASAPNLSGISAYTVGSGSVLAVAAVATGGSTSITNASWDVYVQLAAFSGGTYNVQFPPGVSWANIDTATTSPGGASSTVVVGAVTNQQNSAAIFGPTGTVFSGNPHVVVGSGTLAASTLTVTLTGLAAFSSSSSVACSASDQTTAGTAINAKATSGTTLVFTAAGGSNTDQFTYQCAGN